MCVRLNGFLEISNSATSSRSNRLASGILGPERYSANPLLSELGICHETSNGSVVAFCQIALWVNVIER